jgi:hypothetical protein
MVRGVLQPLSRAQLERLFKVAPSKDERKILAEYRGDVSELATVEQYFAALGKVPRIRRRLRLLLLREEAPGLASYDPLGSLIACFRLARLTAWLCHCAGTCTIDCAAFAMQPRSCEAASSWKP